MATVSIIGAGNIAWIFGARLKSEGYQVREVCSSGKGAGKKLAKELDAQYLDLDTKLDGKSNFYLLAVNDGAIAECMNIIPSTKGLVIHFSGSTSLHAITHRSRAVLWPLRSISRGHNTDWKSMNIVMESDSDLASVKAMELIQDLGAKAVRMDEQRRKHAHVIAVILNNFSNHLLHMADVLSEEQGMDRKIFQDLLAQALLDPSPAKDRQTGPAIREDHGILEKQSRILSSHPDYQKIYEAMSESIMKTHKK